MSECIVLLSVSIFEFTHDARDLPLFSEDWIYGMHNGKYNTRIKNIKNVTRCRDS